MFNNIQSVLVEIFTKERTIFLIIYNILYYALSNYNNIKALTLDLMNFRTAKVNPDTVLSEKLQNKMQFWYQKSQQSKQQRQQRQQQRLEKQEQAPSPPSSSSPKSTSME